MEIMLITKQIESSGFKGEYSAGLHYSATTCVIKIQRDGVSYWLYNCYLCSAAAVTRLLSASFRQAASIMCYYSPEELRHRVLTNKTATKSDTLLYLYAVLVFLLSFY